MADRRVIFELDLGREPAESPGGVVTTATATTRVTGSLVANPDGAGGLVGLFPGWWGYEPIAATIRITPIGLENAVIVESHEGLNTWFVHNQTVANVGITANAGRDCLFASHNVAPIPTTILQPGFALDGDAESLWAAPDAFDGVVEFRRLFAANTTGQLLVGEFAAETELDPNGFGLDARTRVELQHARMAGVGVTLNGGTVVHQCNRTYVDPWSRLWLGPGDVGLGARQLPPSLDLITAESLRRFPSIFIRRADSIRGVRAPAAATDNGVNTGQSAPAIYQVNRPPLFSRWRLWLDGRLADVILAHPAGSDFRTPVAAWNGVFAADALQRQDYRNPLPIYRRVEPANPNEPPIFAVQGHITRMPFLEAAEFVEFFDDERTPIATLVLLS